MTELPWLEDEIWFPPVDQALDDPAGLLAVGGDLSPERLLYAYQRGIFPWFEDDQPILWWSPNPRTVLFPERIHSSRSLRKTLRQGRYSVTADKDFEGVITACAESRAEQQGTWITEEMIEAYQRLHQLGHAHSVETWRQTDSGPELVGGLYGIAIGKVFFGESMFSRANDASKVAYVHLAKQLHEWDFAVIDCQMASSHLFSLGAEEIGSEQWQQLLQDYTKASDANWGDAFNNVFLGSQSRDS